MDDIQSSVNHGLELLRAIDAVEQGMEPQWESGGNASIVTIRPDGAHIENLFAIPPAACDLSLDDLRMALTTWVQFLEQERAGSQHAP